MNILASLVRSKRLSLFLSGMGLVVALHAASGWSWAQAPDAAAPLEEREQAAVEADSGLDAAPDAAVEASPDTTTVEPTDASATTPESSDASGTSGIRFGETRTVRLKVGIRIKTGGECKGIDASVPIPMDWPEQEVRVVEEEISADVRGVDYRTLEGGVKQMLLSIPRLGKKETCEAILTLDIDRKVILPPERTDIYQVPKTVPRDVKRFLGDSPYIESRHPKIRTLAREIVKDKSNGWAQAEAIYDYVRANVEYRESDLKGAVDALKDKVGDCEAMTSLFVALCRAAKIPARMVWVTDHSYPEFYLVDDQNKGHWFPCQISGGRAFGEMPETRPILQKGDNYRVPESKERRRYVAVQLTATAVRGGSPRIEEIVEQGSP